MSAIRNLAMAWIHDVKNGKFKVPKRQEINNARARKISNNKYYFYVSN
jgi:hypothetical protein